MPTTKVAIRLGVDGKEEVKRDWAEVRAAGEQALDGISTAAQRAADRQMASWKAQAAAAKAGEVAAAQQSGFNRLLGVNDTPAKSARESAAAFEELTAKVGLSSTQMQVFVGAAHHSIDALIAGANPVRVFAMEAAKAGPALAGVGGGANLLTLAFNPMTLAIGAGILAMVLGAKAALDHQQAMDKLASSADGVGRMSRAAGQDLGAIAEQGAKAANISVKAAEEQELALLSTGKIGASVFEGLIGVSRTYARVMGEDLSTAAKQLAEDFADPAKGAETLNDKLGFLDSKTLEYIQTLARQNDKTAAQSALLKALQHDLAGAADHTNIFAQAWHNVHVAADDAFVSIGRALDRNAGGGSTAEKIADLEAKAATPFGGLVRGISIDPELARLRAQQAREVAAANTARTRRMAAQGGDLADSLLGYDQRGAMGARLNNLNAAAAAGPSAFDPEHWARLQEAIGQTTRAYQTWMPEYQKQIALDQIDAQIAKARSPARKAELEAQKEKIRLSGQMMTASEAEAAAAAKGEKARGTASKAGESHAATLAREAAAMDANAAAGLDVARAYLDSAAAGEQAEARRKALTEATKKGIDVDAQVRRQQAVAAADAAINLAKEIEQQEHHTAIQHLVNDQISAGLVPAKEANKVTQQAIDLAAKEAQYDRARGEAKKLLRLEIDRLKSSQIDARLEDARTAKLVEDEASDARMARLRAQQGLVTADRFTRERALAGQAASDRLGDSSLIDGGSYNSRMNSRFRADREFELSYSASNSGWAQQQLKAGNDNIEILTKELTLVGHTAAERDRIIAALHEEQALKAQGVDLTSAEAQALIAQAAHIADINTLLQQHNAEWSEFRSTGEKIVDDVLNPDGWKNWGDVGKAVIKDLLAEFIKLEIANPLKNALFGGNAPTGSGFGGFFSSLFGGGQGGGASNFPIGIPGYATGTTNSPDGWSWVGEQGPELVRLPGHSQVMPSDKSLRAAAGPGGGVVNITLNAQGAGPRETEVLMNRLDQLERDLPALIHSNANNGIRRRIIRAA